jgi:hypothetical protein
MPLSGAAMISENTEAASFNRLAGSLSAASNGAIAKVVSKIVLMFIYLSFLLVQVACHSVEALAGR